MDIRTLINQKENTKIDFKREWYWSDNTPNEHKEAKWGECIKDILAITNGNPQTVNEKAYLVIGIEDATKRASTFDFPKDKNGVLTEEKLQQTLLSKLNTFSQPEFTALDVQYHDFDNNIIIVISIPPRGKLMSLSKDLKLNNTTDKKGTTYYRIGEEIHVVSSDIYEDFSKARQNNSIEIIKLIEILGGKEEEFLVKYFGDDYKAVLENPQTYSNLKRKLLNTNTQLSALLTEKDELGKKLKLLEFDSDTHQQVEMAISELRFDDAIAILDSYLLNTSNIQDKIYQVHYMKAIVYVQDLEYQLAKDEMEYIPYVKVDDVALLSDYAQIYKLVGNYPNSLEIYDYVLATKQEAIQSNLYLLALLYNNAAEVAEIIGNYEYSEKYYKEALTIMHSYNALESEEVAIVYDNLGAFLDSQSCYNEAEEYIEKALHLRKKLFGDASEQTMKSNNNLAVHYVHLGEYGKAESLFKSVLDFRLKHFGEFHPEVATSYNNLAELYRKKGNYNFDEVKELYEKSIVIVKNFFSETHNETANKYNNLGELFRENKNPKKALEYYNSALSIYQKNFMTEEHPIIATLYNNMALAYQDIGNHIKAFEYHDKALHMRKKLLPKNHYEIGVSHANLSGFYLKLKQWGNAYKHISEAVRIWKECLPSEHPNLKQAIYIQEELRRIVRP